jgi:hypothetical protein
VLYLHGRCHMRSGTVARYEKKSRTLIVTCKVCGREVARVLVAEHL